MNAAAVVKDAAAGTPAYVVRLESGLYSNGAGGWVVREDAHVFTDAAARECGHPDARVWAKRHADQLRPFACVRVRVVPA